MQRLCKIHVLAAISGIWCSAAHAENTPLTLTAAVELAASHSPALMARRAAVQAADAVVVSAGQLPDPELVVGLEDVPTTGNLAFSLSRDEFTGRKVGIMQSFPRKLKRDLRRQRAGDEVQLAQAQQASDELSVKREAALSWIAAYTAEQSLRRLQALEPLMLLQTRIASAGVSSGQLTSSEALASQAALLEFRDRVRVAEQGVRRARLDLRRWLPQDADRELAEPPRFDQLPVPAGQLLSGIHEHASLRTYDARLEAARTDIALAQADKRPDWSVELDYANRAAPFSDMVTLEFRIGLPLFSGRRQDPVIAGKRAKLREVEAELDTEVRMHSAEISQEIADWEALKVRLKTYEEELVPLSQARSRAALAAYQSTSTSVKSVLDARAAEIDAHMRALELRGQLGSAWAMLNYLQDQRSVP
jgi:outer membrane protein TolC